MLLSFSQRALGVLRQLMVYNEEVLNFACSKFLYVEIVNIIKVLCIYNACFHEKVINATNNGGCFLFDF